MSKSASELLGELDKVAATFPGVALDDNIPPPIKEALIAIGTLRSALPELQAVVEQAESCERALASVRADVYPDDLNLLGALSALREKLEQA